MLDLPNVQWRVLDQAHRKRNIMEYEGVTDIDEGLLEATIRATEEVAARILDIYSEMACKGFYRNPFPDLNSS